MNDRLGDLGGNAVPSWAMDDAGTTDEEAGFIENVQGVNGLGTSNGASNGTTWNSTSNEDEDDFDFAPSSTTDAEDNLQEVEQQSYMDQFFKDVDEIKGGINEIERVTKRIGELNEEANFSVSETKEKELGAELRPLINATNTKAKQTKTLLTYLKEENEKLETAGTVKSSDMRVRENLCNTLTRKFIDEMKIYQAAQQKYKSDIKSKAERQILTVKEDATPEEIDQIMQSEGGREEFFQQQILDGGVNDNIKQAYTKVATKYQDMIALEQSVAELHQMFLDFALLTEQQGELIDQIEYNVKSAADYVEDANVQVHEAIEYSKSIRKKQCCIIVIVIVLTFIVLFSLGILP